MIFQPSNVGFAEKLSFSRGDNVVVYKAKNMLDMPFFCYIRCGLDGYKRLKYDYEAKVFSTPDSYGEVIYRDNIPEPDDKAKKFLENWLKDKE